MVCNSPYRLCLFFCIHTCVWISWIKLVSFLPLTSMVKVQVALFPDWSAVVYVIMWVPWLNLSNGLWFDDMLSRTPELSVAAGSVQFTSAENRPRSAYTTNGLDGHVASNIGGKTSAILTSSSLDTTLLRILYHHTYVFFIPEIIASFLGFSPYYIVCVK